MAKITFLMKVFNGESFVGKTIESVLNQSEPDIRLFLRNNASKDNSGKICRAYAKKDPRVVYLENQRPYLSDEGYPTTDIRFWPEFDSEYVSIVDHDDLLSPNFAQIMYERAKSAGAQMVIGGNSFIRGDHFVGSRVPTETVIDLPGSFGELFQEMYGCLRTSWGKLYETAWYQENYDVVSNTPEDLTYNADTYYILTFLTRCRRIATVGLPLYHYFIHGESGFNSNIRRERIHDGAVLFRAGKKLLEYYHIDTPDNIKFLYGVHLGHMCDLMEVLCNTRNLDSNGKIEYIQAIIDDELVQNYRSIDFLFLWSKLFEYLQRLLSASGYRTSLWQYYIVRLYDVYINKKREQEKSHLLFTQLLSVISDRKNKTCFGAEFYSLFTWSQISEGERAFLNLTMERKQEYARNLYELKRFLAEGDPEKYIEKEDALASSVEEQDMEKAVELLEILNKKYAIDEYAFYYRIYLSELIGEKDFAKKQSYEALVFWSESREIVELCHDILEK